MPSCLWETDTLRNFGNALLFRHWKDSGKTQTRVVLADAEIFKTQTETDYGVTSATRPLLPLC